MNRTDEPQILYEDPYLTLAVKPALWLSQSGKDEAAGLPDMVSYLCARQRAARRVPEGSDVTSWEPYVGVVHRLDFGVGGLMVYAKKPRAAAVLSDAVATRTMTKQYLCVTNGVPAEPAGEYRDLLYKDAKQNKVYVVDTPRVGVKEAVLSYEVLAQTAINGELYALLRVTLGTGRSHQIRAQLSHHGTPIVGDGKYGGRRMTADDASAVGAILPAHGELALFSHRLAFSHPANAEKTKKNIRHGGKRTAKSETYADIDLTVYPDAETLPWAYFSETVLSSSL